MLIFYHPRSPQPQCIHSYLLHRYRHLHPQGMAPPSPPSPRHGAPSPPPPPPPSAPHLDMYELHSLFSAIVPEKDSSKEGGRRKLTGSKTEKVHMVPFPDVDESQKFWDAFWEKVDLTFMEEKLSNSGDFGDFSTWTFKCTFWKDGFEDGKDLVVSVMSALGHEQIVFSGNQAKPNQTKPNQIDQ